MPPQSSVFLICLVTNGNKLHFLNKYFMGGFFPSLQQQSSCNRLSEPNGFTVSYFPSSSPVKLPQQRQTTLPYQQCSWKKMWGLFRFEFGSVYPDFIHHQTTSQYQAQLCSSILSFCTQVPNISQAGTVLGKGMDCCKSWSWRTSVDKGLWDKPVVAQAQPPLHGSHFAPWGRGCKLCLSRYTGEWRSESKKGEKLCCHQENVILLLELDVADKSVMMRRDNDGALQPWPEISWFQTTS